MTGNLFCSTDSLLFALQQGGTWMSFKGYDDILAEFAHLRVRISALAEFGFRRKGKSGWEYVAPIDGTSLECRVFISARGVIAEKVVDRASDDDYAL